MAEPNILAEHAIDLFDKILLPAEKPYTHAFLGPLPQPLEKEGTKDVSQATIKSGQESSMTLSSI